MGTIAQELTRIQNAKASLKTSIENKGVQVPANTLIDGYPALVDQISGGGGSFKISNAAYLFAYDLRTGDEFTQFYDALENVDNLYYAFCTNTLNNISLNDLKTKLGNKLKNVTFAFDTAKNISGTLDLSDIDTSELTNFRAPFWLANNNNLTTFILDGCDLHNCVDFASAFCGNVNYPITISAIGTIWGNRSNKSNGAVFKYVNADEIDLSTMTLNNTYEGKIFEECNVKKVTMPNLSNKTSGGGYLFYGLNGIEEAPIIPGKVPASNTYTKSRLFHRWQFNITDKTKLVGIDIERYFNDPKCVNPQAYNVQSAVEENAPFGIVTTATDTSNNYPMFTHIKEITNLDLSGSALQGMMIFDDYKYSYGGNHFCRLKVKEGTQIGNGTTTQSLYLASIWRGSASSTPTWDTEGKTTEDYVIEFFNSLGTNTSGYTRNIRIYSGLYNTLSQSTKDIAINKNYTLVSTSTY